jgi:hypothetical protein
VATLSAGWHRPSDAVAALLIVGSWAAVAGLFIALAQRRHGDVSYGPASSYTTVFLSLVSLGLLLGAALCLRLTEDVIPRAVGDLSRGRLFVAYAGGALGITGTAGLMIAAVLSTVHRVVPHVVPDDEPPSPAARSRTGPAPAAPLRTGPVPSAGGQDTRRLDVGDLRTVNLGALDPGVRRPGEVSDAADRLTVDLDTAGRSDPDATVRLAASASPGSRPDPFGPRGIPGSPDSGDDDPTTEPIRRS